jgi:hypothetical protein
MYHGNHGLSSGYRSSDGLWVAYVTGGNLYKVTLKVLCLLRSAG